MFGSADCRMSSSSHYHFPPSARSHPARAAVASLLFQHRQSTPLPPPALACSLVVACCTPTRPRWTMVGRTGVHGRAGQGRRVGGGGRQAGQGASRSRRWASGRGWHRSLRPGRGRSSMAGPTCLCAKNPSEAALRGIPGF